MSVHRCQRTQRGEIHHAAMLHVFVQIKSLDLHSPTPQAGRMQPRHAALATLVATIWGFNFVVIEWGMHDVPPLLFVALRFTAVVVPAVFLVPRPSIAWPTVVAVGLLMSLGQFGLLYTSIHLGMPPGLAALVLQAQVVFTVVIAAVPLRERPRPAQVAGVALGVAGLLVAAVGKGGRVPAI